MTDTSRAASLTGTVAQAAAMALCQNQVMAFYRDLDENRYEDLADRLAPGGAWHRQGKVLSSRQAVLDALAPRSKTQRIHHLIVNLVTDSQDEERCRMRAYMLVVRHDSGSPPQGTAPLTGIENIRSIHIELVCTDGAWLIREMRGDEPTFAMPAPRA
ncbi:MULTISPECIES: nuclear transport factor 2 family protein [unclassified Achromobacter]|uniref:nuclear transport factor 2 family protein n=1 Tax=unclassified Achromobacter TaxID=2626865 RepID=UPI001E5033FF|nr:MULTISPECIES: nuclear transport factor 2 family protein [unclassified Achromobacter]